MVKQTANPESPREKRFLRLYRNTCKDTHIYTYMHSVYNRSLYLRAWASGYLLNICLSSLKTGAAAGVNSSQQPATGSYCPPSYFIISSKSRKSDSLSLKKSLSFCLKATCHKRERWRKRGEELLGRRGVSEKE